MAINASGEVVLTANVEKNATFSITAGAASTIKPPMAMQVFASGVIDSGVIVGTEVTSAGIYGYQRANGTYARFTVPGAAATSLMVVSDIDAMIGRDKDSAGVRHAFLAVPGAHVVTIDYPGAAAGDAFLRGLAGNLHIVRDRSKGRKQFFFEKRTKKLFSLCIQSRHVRDSRAIYATTCCRTSHDVR